MLCNAKILCRRCMRDLKIGNNLLIVILFNRSSQQTTLRRRILNWIHWHSAKLGLRKLRKVSYGKRCFQQTQRNATYARNAINDWWRLEDDQNKCSCTWWVIAMAVRHTVQKSAPVFRSRLSAPISGLCAWYEYVIGCFFLVMDSISHLSGWNSIIDFFSQSHNKSRSFCRVFASWSYLIAM